MVGRRETPIDPSRPFADFANGLRELRANSMKTFEDIAVEVNYGRSVLCAAASGRRLPTFGVTLAFVRACGGEEDEWARRWQLEAPRQQRRRPRW
ncbi:helix-turn-helix domain-containing protein [Dactylosporangium sucinum]|uniref:HTH cro/C1-type domain-containing protein n=1 Tax=Dactylosporangium sucinum TaxID=1424081 RepID=A0A917THF3_9ACTN|nr:helix-turn-helix transcriptional regulator [Dactylosporangium sucinum]GGM23600.1 hypothetical protein GCM10007977_025990 [Dactylosporangium sucinum]